MVIEFRPVGGLVVADAEAKDVLLHVLDVGEDVEVSSDCLIHELRLMISNDQLDPGSVIVMFEGDRIEFDEYGNIEGIWPDGFADTSLVLVKNLFDMHLAKRRGELS